MPVLASISFLIFKFQFLNFMFLIADSGSTKTDWCVVDNGKIRQRIATQGINPFHQSDSEISRIVGEELVPQIEGTVDSVFFYGSGCREELCPNVAQALANHFPAAVCISVANDLLGAARAVCGDKEGIACILGTGANSCLYDGRRIVANTPPLGYILGDEGSGAVLGRLFLNALYKGALSKELKEEFENETGLTMASIIGKVYREPLANRFLASLSPFIGRHTNNDGVRALVVDNFRQFFRRNVAAYNRLDLPVGFVGSIASHYRDLLAEAAVSEGFTIGDIVASPIDTLAAYHAD